MPKQNKIVWIEILRRRSTLLFSYFARKGESIRVNVKEALGIDFAMPNAKEVDTRIIIDAKSSDKFRSLISDKVKKDSQYFSQHAKRCLIYCERLLTLAQRISETEVDKLEDKDLRLLYRSYTNRTLELIPFLNSFIFLNDILTEMIKVRSGKEGLGEISLEEVVVPTEINFVVQEIEEMLKIASKVSRRPKLKNAIIRGNQKQVGEILNEEREIKRLIDNHIRKFGWTTTQAYVGDFMKSEDVIRRLQNLLLKNPQEKLAEAKQRRQKAKRRFRKLLKNPKLSKETKGLFKIASQYLYLRFLSN